MFSMLGIQTRKQNEPIIAHEVKAPSFAKVGRYLLQFAGKDSLIVVDYFSIHKRTNPVADNNTFNSQEFIDS